MAQVVVEMSGDEAKLFRSYQKIIDQASKLDQKHKDLKKSSADAGQQAEQSFGGTASSAIGKYAAGMISLQAATQAFGAAMAYSKGVTDAAVASVEKLIATRSQLQQVSSSGAENQQLNDFAEKLGQRGISRAAAQEIIFSAKSEGFTGSEDIVARIMAANELNSGSIRTLAGQIPGVFNGAISPIQGIAGGAMAAKYSRLSTDELAAILPKAAQGGAVAGSSPAETMAMAGVLATRGDRASEYMGTFAAQLATGDYRKQFAGIGVMGMVRKLQGMPEGERQKILGTGKETNLSYMWLSQDMAKISDWTSSIQGAMDNAEGFAGDVEGKAFDPSTAVGRMMIGRRGAIVAENALEASRESRLAEGGYRRRATVSRAVMRDEASTLGPMGRWMSSSAMSAAETAGMPDMAIEGAGRIARSSGVALFERAVVTLGQAADKLLEGAGMTNRQRAAANQQVE